MTLELLLKLSKHWEKDFWGFLLLLESLDYCSYLNLPKKKLDNNYLEKTD